MVHTVKHQTDTPVAVPLQGDALAEDALEVELQVALEHARRLTDIYGTTNPQVAVAWDVVEELSRAKAKRREQSITSLQAYCNLYPEAPECRMYDT